MASLRTIKIEQVVDHRLKSLRSHLKCDVEEMSEAAAVLDQIVDERNIARAGRSPEGRIFGRIMDLGTENVAKAAMITMLALEKHSKRWPPSGVMVDDIGSLQNHLTHSELTELMQTASRWLRQSANRSASTESTRTVANGATEAGIR